MSEIPDLNREIDAALSSDCPIGRSDVVTWIIQATDLVTLSKLYRLTGESYYRIEPELGSEITCSLILRYFLECIKQDSTDNDEILGRWEAADTLHMWLRQLLNNELTAVVSSAAQEITSLYLASGDEVRTALEQGFLEHALETAAIRPFFEHWSTNEELREAWRAALEWGLAHADFMWNLRMKNPSNQS